MPHVPAARGLRTVARHVPGLRRIPVAKLLVAAEIALMARDHVMQLDRSQRHRFFVLLWTARGRRGKLTDGEREELAGLINRMEPRLLAGEAADRLSPVPLPRRLVYGPRRR